MHEDLRVQQSGFRGLLQRSQAFRRGVEITAACQRAGLQSGHVLARRECLEDFGGVLGATGIDKEPG
ncbi:MAG: hypothetical protein ACFHWZ_15625 [Phycisphaerales bacterium]